MVPKDADNRYDDLLSGGVPAASEDYSLEEILAEFGAGEEQRLLRGTEAEETPPSAPPQPRQREAAPAQAPAQPRRKEAAPAVPAQPEPPGRKQARGGNRRPQAGAGQQAARPAQAEAGRQGAASASQGRQAPKERRAAQARRPSG